MATTATVRFLSPEEIASRPAGTTPYLLWPNRATVFAERAMRLRQLATHHPMGDFLRFLADLVDAQQKALAAASAHTPPLPDDAALDRAAREGEAPLDVEVWRRDPCWRDTLRTIVETLRPDAPAGPDAVLARLAGADDDTLERQADLILTGQRHGVDVGMAPLIGAALQVYWLDLVDRVRARHASGNSPDANPPFGRIADEAVCPCCASRPTASVTRSTGDSLGQRYLSCSLCGTQWHVVRIKCTRCHSTKSVAYQALDTAGGEEGEEGPATSSRVAHAVIQAETCDECRHYLKIMHTDRDAFVDAVADDIASLTLDLLVSETGMRRHGVNLLLHFASLEAEDATPVEATGDGAAGASPTRPPPGAH